MFRNGKRNAFTREAALTFGNPEYVFATLITPKGVTLTNHA